MSSAGVEGLEALLEAHPFPIGEGTKDERGTLVLIGGPAECPGAIVLGARSALRTGTGRVQVVVHPAVAPTVGVAVPEVLSTGWDLEGAAPAAVVRLLERAAAVVLGPGTARCSPDLVARVVAAASGAQVLLDAGALSQLDAALAEGPVVVAPNASEARRLEPSAADHPEQAVLRLLERTSRAAAVRGPVTHLAGDDRRVRAHEGPACLGTPGSGDVFMGIAGGLLSRGLDPAGALAWATMLHAEAGLLLEARRPVGWLASDLVDVVPQALARRIAPEGADAA